MEVSYKYGKIIIDGYFYEEIPYDVATDRLGVRFNGQGGLSKYLVIADGKEYSPRSFFSLYKDGEAVGAYTVKHTECVGRVQEITLSGDDFRIYIKQFVVKDKDAIFNEITISSPEKSEFVLHYGMSTLFYSSALCCSEECSYVDENAYFEITQTVSGEKSIRVVYSYNQSIDYCKALLDDFGAFKEKAYGEISSVEIPSSVTSEMEKALYLSALFCAVENFKVQGDFKAFAAGCNYVDPLRTYFRDSYWTSLAVYRYDVSLVKSQIVTLAKGIGEDGSCPSAVKGDFSAFWNDHYDSPAFFVMMTYDYVNHTGNIGFLNEKINGNTVINICLSVMDKYSEHTDESGLLYKEGKYNKRDWADEVNRNGYVTYNEALYYRALCCMNKLCSAVGLNGRDYKLKAEKVKDAINSILWNEEKGYYVNYKDEDFVEDNLSVDTITTYLFGIADERRAKRLLDAMERLLETKNNPLQRAGDYGIMCVYPFYKRISATYFKSSQDYEYHNGGNWPYWSAMYAYAKYLAGRDYTYALTSWFTYNAERGVFTPIEYFSPCRRVGSTLQAWSAASAFVFDFIGKKSFFAPTYLR